MSHIRKWHRGRCDHISRELDVVNWDDEFLRCDTPQMYSRFSDILLPLVDDFVPTGDPNNKPASLPWKTNPPRSLRTERKHAWEKYKEVRHRLGRNSAASESALLTFFSLNCSLKRFALDSQASYEFELLKDSAENPKALHAYLRRKKVGCPGVGPLRLVSSSLADDPVVMAESFAEAFEGVCARSPKP